ESDIGLLTPRDRVGWVRTAIRVVLQWNETQVGVRVGETSVSGLSGDSGVVESDKADELDESVLVPDGLTALTPRP
ncbi:hypothetical protein Tco_1278584, partial [Tanacetum coccineum]